MGKVSKDDKIKLLEAKVSLLEAEVLLKDESLDFMQAGIDELTEKVKELGEKAKYFDAIYDKAFCTLATSVSLATDVGSIVFKKPTIAAVSVIPFQFPASTIS